AEEKKFPVYRFPKYSAPEALEALKGLDADIGIMAYVLLFAPPEFCAIPKHGMIQFHPSLLPLHRGPAAIPWAIIRGRSETGLTIFRLTPGLDEGPIILQKRIPIGPNDTAASLYFDKIFPLGVEALLQAADLVTAGRDGLRSHAQGGFIEVSRLRLGDGAKVKFSEINLPVGTILGAPSPKPDA